MRNTIQASTIIYFIGGGADKTRERFGIIKWGPTNLMGLVKAAFDMSKGAGWETRYYGYWIRKKSFIALLSKSLRIRRLGLIWLATVEAALLPKT